MKAALAAAALLAGCAQAATQALPAGDPARGAAAFRKCYACHSVERGESGLTGPNLHAIVGAPVGREAGFDYSPALRALAARQARWDPASLDRFIADPEQVAPGTSMTFTGMADPQERADLIAWLRAAGR